MANVRAARTAKLNYMTIPQLRQANVILQKKINEAGNVNNPTLKDKLIALSNEYDHAERQINKYYQRNVNNPKTSYLVRGKRNMLTIARINKKDYTRKHDKTRYGLTGFMRDIRADKIALGVGVSAMGLGVLAAIPNAANGNLLQLIIKEVMKWITKNPLASSLLISGAVLVAASKIVPKCYRAHQRISNGRANLNAAKNDIANDMHKDDISFENLSNDKFENNMESFVQDIIDHPEHYNNLDPNDLTPSQLANLEKARKEAENRKADIREDLGIDENAVTTEEVAPITKEDKKIAELKEKIAKQEKLNADKAEIDRLKAELDDLKKGKKVEKTEQEEPAPKQTEAVQSAITDIKALIGNGNNNIKKLQTFMAGELQSRGLNDDDMKIVRDIIERQIAAERLKNKGTVQERFTPTRIAELQ